VDVTTQLSPAARAPRSLPAWLGVLAVPASVALVLAGIWVAGGVLTDDFRLSMGLTVLWFVLVVAGSGAAWRLSRVLRPAAVVAVLAFAVVAGWLGLSSIRDVRVDERVATGPALAQGSFRSLAHSTEGTARIVERAGRGRVLTLTAFRTDPGPDLFVYVVPGLSDGRSVDGGTRLAALKGNVGNQQYALPSEVPVGPLTVVVWCRAFSVPFGAALVEPV
jgi:hypothetical protein